jgi:hypothetical protein
VVSTALRMSVFDVLAGTENRTTFVFGRSRIHISVLRPAIMNEVSRDFTKSLQEK